MKAFCIPSLAKALDTVKKVIAAPRFKTVNAQQDIFINEMVEGYKMPEVTGSAKLLDRNNFMVKGKLDITVSWKKKGEKDYIPNGKKEKGYKAVKMKSEGFTFGYAKGHKEPVFKLKTKTGDRCYLTETPVPTDEFDMLTMAKSYSRFKESYDFNVLVFPCVQMAVKEKIAWMLKLIVKDKNDTYRCTKAEQHNKLTMDEVGAKVKSETFMGFTKGIRRDHTYKIDKPFLVWFKRPGMERPYFVAYVTKNFWKGGK